MTAAHEGIEEIRLAARRALTLGVSRDPMAVPAWLASGDERADLLSLVSALGLRNRFERPVAPEQLDTFDAGYDAARMPPSASRLILCRLFAPKKKLYEENTLAMRTLDLLAARGLHLHPFDYPALRRLMAGDESVLDEHARTWLSRERPSDDGGPSFGQIIQENWTEFPPAVREDYIRRLRSSDPDGARALCEEALANDAATVRRKVLGALAVRLGASDVPYLESFAEDRAKSVRAVASSLLARIPGTAAYAERIDQAHEQITVQSAGIIGRKKVLLPKIPKGLAASREAEWVAETFADVNPSELAQRLGLAPKKFAESLGPTYLRDTFLLNALQAGDLEMAALIGAQLDARDASLFLMNHESELAGLGEPQRHATWGCFTNAFRGRSLHDACAVVQHLYTALRVPPPDGAVDASALERSWGKWARDAVADPERVDGYVPRVLIAFSGRQDRADWRARMQILAPSLTTDAFAIADLFDAVEAHPLP